MAIKFVTLAAAQRQYDRAEYCCIQLSQSSLRGLIRTTSKP
jgi:hypothetical protein